MKRLWSVRATKTEILFGYPCGVAWAVINDIDTAIVIDARVDTITLLNARNGEFIKKIQTGYTEKDKPESITVDKDNNVYISYAADVMKIGVRKNNFKEQETFLDVCMDDFHVPHAITYREKIWAVCTYPTVTRISLIVSSYRESICYSF